MWEVGPQKRLYIPAPLLREGTNDLLVLETDARVGTAELVDEPDLGGGNAGGRGGFSERSSATSIGAAYGRLFRLRKTAMLSRHWRLWLSFPSPPRPLSPEERLAFGGCISA